MDALVSAKASAVEVRLVRNLAQTLGCNLRVLPYPALLEIAQTNRVSLKRAIDKAEAHGFIVVDRASVPFAYRIASAFLMTGR